MFPSLCPPGHRPLSDVSQEGLPPPPVCLQLDRATGGPETMSPSTGWECGGTHWWAVLPGAAIWGGVRSVLGFFVGCRGDRGGSPALPSAAASVWPLPPQVGPQASPPCPATQCHSLPLAVPAHPQASLQPCREASPSGLWLAVRPASAHPAVRFPIRE